MAKYRDIKGYEGRYQISNTGVVRSLNRKVNGGYGPRIQKSQIIKQHPTVWGYMRVLLYKKSKAKNKPVHRLVAEAFIPNPQNLRCVNHKDGIKTNNNVENLEWCTNKHNTQHALKMGLMNRIFGENNVTSKLTNVMVREIRDFYKNDGWSQRQLARKYGVTQPMINYIVNRKYWKHI